MRLYAVLEGNTDFDRARRMVERTEMSWAVNVCP